MTSSRVLMSTEIDLELKKSLPYFRFRSLGFSSRNRAYRGVEVSCKRCWSVDDNRLKSLIKSREELGRQVASSLFKDRKELKAAWQAEARAVKDLHPKQQRERLRRARLMFESRDNALSLIEEKINFNEYLVATGHRANDVLTAVDWALKHKCGATKEEARILAHELFVLGVDSEEVGKRAAKGPAPDGPDLTVEGDLLDLVQDD